MEAEQVPEVRNGPSQSKIVLAKPRLGGFGGVGLSESNSGNPFNKSGTSSLLRPPQLKPVLSNPFLRVQGPQDEATKEETTKEEIFKENKKEETEPPKFVPLGGNARPSNPVPAPSQAAPSASGFVFGQNLSERVVSADALNNGACDPHASTNGNSELLFTAAASKVDSQTSEEAGHEGGGLAEAAAEYERSHARPAVPATRHPTTTGEEQETNVLQMTCRLYAWEAGSWRERGRGALRLNEGARGARLVVRVLGSLRVALNTNVWPHMVNERAGAKSLRITATDVQNHVKVFLVMANPSDILHLSRELATRIARATSLRSAVESLPEPTHYAAPPADDFPEDVDNTSKLQDLDEMSHDAADIPEQAGDAEEVSPRENGESVDSADETKESQQLKRKDTDAVAEVAHKKLCPDTVE